MRAVFLSNRRGIVVGTVPAPTVGDGEVLIANSCSLISTGTELQTLKSAKEHNGIRQFRDPGSAVRKVIRKLNEGGIHGLVQRLTDPPETLSSLGYSTAGIVSAVGRHVTDLSPGDRVIGAGAQAAHHAEVVSVPRMLVARVPEGVPLAEASFTTLGAIAMQGVRRAECGLGETVAVIGLGLLGLLAVQVAKAAGLRVVGLDIAQRRVELAKTLGADLALLSDAPDTAARVSNFTAGFGADAVLLYAATASSDPVNLGFDLCRQRGRVVIVGAVGLHLERERMYRKELSVLMSTSYGPGRYDALYEEAGVDYPIGYVRWTENRQMQAFLELLAAGKVKVLPLVAKTFPIADAPAAYRLLQTDRQALAVLLEYGVFVPPPTKPETRTHVPARLIGNGPVRIAVIGLGGFIQGNRLPDLRALSDLYHLSAVVSSRSEEAAKVAKTFQVDSADTDYRRVLHDPQVELVLVGNRHDHHAMLTVAGLRAGKAMFVEKPLCLTLGQLDEICEAVRETDLPVFVGFNRRYSPFMRAIQAMLAKRDRPIMLTYRINVGPIAPGHWTLDPTIGGDELSARPVISSTSSCT